MADSSFDIVSKVDKQEVDNAINQAAKEVATRYDFKGVGASIAWSGDDVVISHHGRAVTTLRGARAAAFLEDVELGDDQELMARVTGNYRRGNERQARNHPRNRQPRRS